MAMSRRSARSVVTSIALRSCQHEVYGWDPRVSIEWQCPSWVQNPNASLGLHVRFRRVQTLRPRERPLVKLSHSDETVSLRECARRNGLTGERLAPPKEGIWKSSGSPRVAASSAAAPAG